MYLIDKKKITSLDDLNALRSVVVRLYRDYDNVPWTARINVRDQLESWYYSGVGDTMQLENNCLEAQRHDVYQNTKFMHYRYDIWKVGEVIIYEHCREERRR